MDGRFAWRLRIAHYSSMGMRVFVPLLILTLPLEFTSMYFPTQIIQLSRIVMVFGLIVSSAQVVTHQSPVALPKKLSFAWLALLITYEAISAFVVRSPSGVRSVLMALIYLAVMITVYSWSRTRDDLWRAWGALSLSGLLIGLLAILLHFTNLYIWRPGLPSYLHRMNATFGDPNIFARFLAITTGTSIMLLEVAKRRVERYIMLASVLVGAVAVVFTYSRAGWLVFALTVLLSVLLTKHRRNALIAVALLVCIITLVAISNRTVFRRTQDILSLVNSSSAPNAAVPGPKNASFGLLDRIPLDVERHYLIAAGIKMFIDHPVFGVGFGQFQSHIQGRYRYFLQPGYPDRLSHTALVTVLAELGLVGLALLLSWLFWLFREIFEANRITVGDKAFLLVPIPAIFAVLAHSQFEERLLAEPYLWVFIALLYAAQSRYVVAANSPGK